MANFCTNCGTRLEPGSRFCPGCGAAQNPVLQQKSAETYRSPGYLESGNPMRSGYTAPIRPGYSDRVNHPEIVAAVKKNRRATGIFGLILVPIPFIGFAIYGNVSEEMDINIAVIVGGVVSAIFLIFALVGLLKGYASGTYDAVVVDKKTKEIYRNNDSRASYTEFITIVRTSDGKQKTITEKEGGMNMAYDYLKIGDQFRYHPQFGFPYELYDKSRAPFLPCVGCCTKNPVTADRCKRCNLPLLK